MGLQTEGIIFIALAWTCVISLLVYCYGRILKSERKKGEEEVS